MSTYQCPKCGTEFLLGTKFCQNCGCNLEFEFIETPTCPKCRKTFPTGTKFCPEDGLKLVSPEKLIPRCIKCGKEYTDGTKFCPEDGGQILPGVHANSKFNTNNFIGKICDTIENSLNNPTSRMNELKKHLGKIVLGLSIIVAVIDAYVILSYFALPAWERQFIGGVGNAFPLYIKHVVLGWVIFACILAVITYFVNGMMLETLDREDKYSRAGSTINRFAGGLAVIFLIVGLLSRVIVGY